MLNSEIKCFAGRGCSGSTNLLKPPLLYATTTTSATAAMRAEVAFEGVDVAVRVQQQLEWHGHTLVALFLRLLRQRNHHPVRSRNKVPTLYFPVSLSVLSVCLSVSLSVCLTDSLTD